MGERFFAPTLTYWFCFCYNKGVNEVCNEKEILHSFLLSTHRDSGV